MDTSSGHQRARQRGSPTSLPQLSRGARSSEVLKASVAQKKQTGPSFFQTLLSLRCLVSAGIRGHHSRRTEPHRREGGGRGGVTQNSQGEPRPQAGSPLSSADGGKPRAGENLSAFVQNCRSFHKPTRRQLLGQENAETTRRGPRATDVPARRVRH